MCLKHDSRGTEGVWGAVTDLVLKSHGGMDDERYEGIILVRSAALVP